MLWSLGEGQCAGPPDRVSGVAPFPHFLYDGGPPAWVGYLLNASVLRLSFEIAVARPHRRSPDLSVVPEGFNAFDKFYRFGRERALAEYEQARHAPPSPPIDIADMLYGCEVNLVATMRAHPEIAFDVILPPYSILVWKLEFERNPERLRQRLEFSRQLIERFVALPNVRVFDFRDAAKITHDLDRYKDMSHFDASVTRAIAQAIGAGRHRVDPSDPRASLRRLAAQAAAYRLPGENSAAN